MMKVAVIMGSKSDFPVMEAAVDELKNFGIEVEYRVVSAHRTPEFMLQYAHDAIKNNIEVIIAGAGGAAHLPGMVAAMTTLPVIGVPVQSKSLNGLDSMLSIVQMPPGVPVATVSINGARNAALLAVRILSIKYPKIREMLDDFVAKQRDSVLGDKL
ncbi:5-(carboxyamino)imidazole ribonucleotide mutase [Ferroplasma sp.]|uniref:5-(carboxyamino)imidazole ribonucleotide mutase n=1 Tax=Ferroplasma sp. TaxID=2591003 RepID=UPI0035CB3ADF